MDSVLLFGSVNSVVHVESGQCAMELRVYMKFDQYVLAAHVWRIKLFALSLVEFVYDT